MYVEDLLLAMRAKMPHGRLGQFDAWQQNFIHNLGDHIASGKPLSTKQSHAVLRLIGSFRQAIVINGMATADDIHEMLQRPQFRRPLYESILVPREVRHLGDNLLAFRFKQHDLIVERIKQFGVPPSGGRTDLLPKPRFDWDYKLWIVPVMRYNLSAIITLINEYQFTADDSTAAYLRLAQRSHDQPSTVTLADADVLVANVCDNPLLAGWIAEIADGIAL